jgi:hypothetical protein
MPHRTRGARSKLAVNFPPVPNRKHENGDEIVSNFADDPVVANPAAP